MSTPTESSMLAVGTVLNGTYRIERHLSSGGFGNNYAQMGVVEELGSGMRKMFKYTLLYANGKEPIIEEHDVYRIEILYISTLLGSDNETTWKTTQKTTRKMLALIKKNPSISREELAEKCGITSDGIKYNIRKLREKGIIKRIGPDKGGHWEVMIEIE